jgi:TRAP-type uncharacterized transport system substrate-binding protein
MKKILWLVLLSSLISSSTMAVELRLMTGIEQGVYYQIGAQASLATDRIGINLQVLPSAGSWENIVALFNSNTEFAIFQVDAFLIAANNLYRNTGTDINDDMRVVMALYREEIHVIKASNRELDFAGLESFVVGCGLENSGSCITASVLEEAYGKEFRYVYADVEASLEKLRGGSIDLLILTAGKPYPLLVGERGLELVSLPTFKKSAEYYSRSTLTTGDYPWLTGQVDTYSVRSVLATMIQEEEGLANDLVGSVHLSLQVNQAELKKKGHPKWKEVLFGGYVDGLTHAAAIQSLRACKTIKSFGYRCTDLMPGQ